MDGTGKFFYKQGKERKTGLHRNEKAVCNLIKNVVLKIKCEEERPPANKYGC